MKILLTGSGGLVGSAILRHGKSRAHEMLTPRSRELNLLDAKAVAEFIGDTRIDMVIHAAGRVGGIDANRNNQADFLYENLTMGMNVVRAAFESGVKNLINLGSSCIYPAEAPNPLTEDMLLTGAFEPTNEGYALAKTSVLKYAAYLRGAHDDLQYATIIPPNMFGPGDNYDPASSHVAAAIIHKIHAAVESNAESVEIWGTGTVMREFMLSDDLADGIWFCAANMEKLPAIINIGVGRDYSINDYYRMAASIIGYKGAFTHNTEKPDGMKRKLMDSSKITALGWKPKWTLDNALAYAYKDYAKHDQVIEVWK